MFPTCRFLWTIFLHTVLIYESIGAINIEIQTKQGEDHIAALARGVALLESKQ
jgi:hypothetical protein